MEINANFKKDLALKIKSYDTTDPRQPINMSPKKSVSSEIKPVINNQSKSHTNQSKDSEVNFILTTYNDSPFGNKIKFKINATPPTHENVDIKHSRLATTYKSKNDADKRGSSTNVNNELKTKCDAKSTNESPNSSSSNKSIKSPTSNAKCATITDKKKALPNVTIAPYDHQQNKHLQLSIMNDNQTATSEEYDINLSPIKSMNDRSVLLNINNQKPVKNAIISPGITIRNVDNLEDITSAELIQRLSVRQLITIVEKEAIDPSDYHEIDELRDKVTKLWVAKELIKERRDDVCWKCLSNKNDCLLLLCGHQTTCIKCSENLSTCPVCKAIIVRKVHVYVT